MNESNGEQLLSDLKYLNERVLRLETKLLVIPGSASAARRHDANNRLLSAVSKRNRILDKLRGYENIGK